MLEVNHLVPLPQLLAVAAMLPFAAFTPCDYTSFPEDSHPRMLPPADWSHINGLLHSTTGSLNGCDHGRNIRPLQTFQIEI